MIFSVTVEPNWEFFSLMLGFGPGVRVLAPNAVVREMKRKLQKALDQYAIHSSTYSLLHDEKDGED